MFNTLGFGNINQDFNGIKFHLPKIEQRLKDQFKQNLNCSLTSYEKLSFFRQVFVPSTRPPYIDICKDKTERSIISKLKLSAHTLAIEKGRYKNIERTNRVCLSCDGGHIEDEYHFFSVCPRYSSLRNEYYNKIKLKLPFFSNCKFNIKEISFLLNSKTEIVKLTARFIKSCLNIRSE